MKWYPGILPCVHAWCRCCTQVQVHVDDTWPHQPWLNDATGKGNIGSESRKWRPPIAADSSTSKHRKFTISRKVHIWSKWNFPIGVYNYRSIELYQCCCLLSILFNTFDRNNRDLENRVKYCIVTFTHSCFLALNLIYPSNGLDWILVFVFF